MDPASDQQVLRDDTTKNCLCIIEEFARFFANLRVVENSRITAAQFPRMEKRRPIDERNQVFKFRYTRADADEFRFRRDVTAPIDASPVLARLRKCQQFFVMRFCGMLLT